MLVPRADWVHAPVAAVATKSAALDATIENHRMLRAWDHPSVDDTIHVCGTLKVGSASAEQTFVQLSYYAR
jgi:hypothetical protein